ncbi:RidA family protein [Arthrobacter sp. MW3 TE3886]|uniref:RidA family protein n=1 Tax=Arthrobacter sp. MW3 TE3886 TaxID=3156254 RepID=UPI0035182F98
MPEQQRSVHPAGSYESVIVFGDTAYVAGMTPRIDGALIVRGTVGREVDATTARDAAKVAASRAVTALTESSITGTVIPLSMTVYVRCVPEFEALGDIADGASEAIAEWSGGLLPARAAVGVAALPGGAPVEVSLVVGIRSRAGNPS